MKQQQAIFRTVSLGAAAVLALAATVPAATLRLKDGRRVEGTNLRVNANGDFVITMGSGQRTYPAAQVQEAMADRPAAYDQAVSLWQAGKVDDALNLLGRVADQYRLLGWDDQANYDAARIHAAQGDYEEAEESFNRVSARFRQRPEVRLSQAQAQIETGSYAEAERALDVLLRSAGREQAARAQVLRGDLKTKRRQLQPAVEDYLRAAILFGDVRSVQPEALYKAGQVLEELRDPRAKDMFAQLQRDYPASDFAARVREQ
jgi:TolA-binding protein